MAAEAMIARYLGLTIGAERALGDAFVLVGARHAAEPEMRNCARLHSGWCRGHVDALRPAVERYSVERSHDGERLRRALFRGRRVGGFGLVRDVHDLMTLAAHVHGGWLALLQAARERRDASLEAVCRACDTETLRHVSWLETKLRHAAPQALTVPAPMSRELRASIPARGEIGAVIDLLPGPTMRGLRPLAPVAGALAVLVLLVLWPTGGRPPVGMR